MSALRTLLLVGATLFLLSKLRREKPNLVTLFPEDWIVDPSPEIEQNAHLAALFNGVPPKWIELTIAASTSTEDAVSRLQAVVARTTKVLKKYKDKQMTPELRDKMRAEILGGLL